MYLNVLIADDCEDDALLIVRELRKSGYEPQFERVETRAGMEQALEQRHWQLIITFKLSLVIDYYFPVILVIVNNIGDRITLSVTYDQC